jgi:hypothetical protein
LEDGTVVYLSARVCTLCPRFRGNTRDLEDEMHLFIFPKYDTLKGDYPRVNTSWVYHQFRSADATHNPEVDKCFRKFLTHRGSEIWSQLAEFLDVYRNARPFFGTKAVATLFVMA